MVGSLISFFLNNSEFYHRYYRPIAKPVTCLSCAENIKNVGADENKQPNEIDNIKKLDSTSDFELNMT